MKKNIGALLIVLGLLLLLYFAGGGTYQAEQERMAAEEETGEIKIKAAKLYAGYGRAFGLAVSEEEKNLLMQALTLEEAEVYSFLQGPRSWGEGIPWSGEWCQFGIRGNTFGGFGCGLCCMANIYDTLSPYEVSPWDMFEYARTASDYYPTGKAGAIGWEAMEQTLKSCGILCGLYNKPERYEEFQTQMKQAKTMIALVCSSEDDTYWQNVPGHYVNLWLYEEETDTVFLAEPGNPWNNRGRIPLRYVYDALKTISSFQYLTAECYREENNQWKGDGIKEVWNRPQT